MKSIDIGSRLELFVDDYIVDKLEGDVELYQHKPHGREVVLSDDKPWEYLVNYFAVLRDGDKYRMYYRGDHHGTGKQALGEATCYAESNDGIHWKKPELGLFTFEGSPKNNIVLGGDLGKFPATKKWQGYLGADIRWRADFVPFIDTRPEVEQDARYKALIRGCRGFHQIGSQRWDYGMYPFKSPDGIHWTLMNQKPVITRGRFDSQNLAFWDAAHNRYVAFVRDCRFGLDAEIIPNDVRDFEQVPKGVWRDVRVCFSDDFINWSDPLFVEYPGEILQQLYTNAVIPYERAPHILIGFPTRFFEEGAQTEPIFMSSRDGGNTFKRWQEALISRDSPAERDGDRSNYMAHGLVRGNDREYFVYATEGYQDGPSRRLRRFTWRVDGFASVSASNGTLTSKLLKYSGNNLMLNYRTRPGGELKVEVLDHSGKVLCSSFPVQKDSISEKVKWSENKLADYSGLDVQLRFILHDAELYSFSFAF